MSGVVLSLADRQPVEVQKRAAVACARQGHEARQRLTLDELLGGVWVGTGTILHASLDDWYRAQPIRKGRIRPALTLSRDEKRLYGLTAGARLVDLRGVGFEVDHWTVAVVPVAGGRVVGLKAPLGGGGVGVLFRLPRKANDYALRLHADHGHPQRP